MAHIKSLYNFLLTESNQFLMAQRHNGLQFFNVSWPGNSSFLVRAPKIFHTLLVA